MTKRRGVPVDTRRNTRYNHDRKPMTVMTLRINRTLMAGVRRKAAEENRTVSNYIRTVLEKETRR